MERDLIVTIGGVETCEKVRFAIDFRDGIPRCSGGMSGSQDETIEASVVNANSKFAVGSPKNN